MMKRTGNVVVFGGAGFVGSHTADALSEVGYDVTVFDLQPSPYLRSDQQEVIGDIRDATAVGAALDGCRVVYNFVGLADISDCLERPLDTVRENVEGNAILLDAAVQSGVHRYVFASTIYVYSEAGSFYRVSKQACELYVEEYQRRYGLDYTILRYGTLYGRRAGAHNAIHGYLKQALTERRIDCVGTGDELREYIHVNDAARASVEILADEFANRHVIITGHHPMRVRDLLAMIREIVGRDVDVNMQPGSMYDDSAKRDSGHYKLTPYNFQPKIGRRLTQTYYLDMGQGLLDVLDEIYQANVD